MQMKPVVSLISWSLLLFECLSMRVEAAKPKKVEAYGPENLLKQKIVPEIIDKKPEMTLGVKYPGNIQVLYGNLLKPIQTKDEPEFSWAAEPGQLYTLFMLSPDAPSREDHNLRNVIHFQKNNIPENRTADGELAVEYVGAAPFQNSGKHRMLFLLYKQHNGERVEFEDLVDKHTLIGRGPLNLKDYATENNLGDPVAANFFMSEWDPYVATIYGQFGFVGTLAGG